jgi:hypothetical protein
MAWRPLFTTKKPRGLLRAAACAPGPEDDIRRARYLNMLISLEGAHVFYVSIFGGAEHLREEACSPAGRNPIAPLAWIVTIGESLRIWSVPVYD